MVERAGPSVSVSTAGLHVTADCRMHVASLRYFDAAGAFGSAMAGSMGVELPGILRAVDVPALDGETADILAWRNPTETLLLSSVEARFHRLEALGRRHADGCFVDQTGGNCVMRAVGGRVPDLFSRLGGSASIPMAGESKRSRLGDVAVLALNVRNETLFVIERVYVEHFMGWVQQIAVDLCVGD